MKSVFPKGVGCSCVYGVCSSNCCGLWLWLWNLLELHGRAGHREIDEVCGFRWWSGFWGNRIHWVAKVVVLPEGRSLTCWPNARECSPLHSYQRTSVWMSHIILFPKNNNRKEKWFLKIEIFLKIMNHIKDSCLSVLPTSNMNFISFLGFEIWKWRRQQGGGGTTTWKTPNSSS